MGVTDVRSLDDVARSLVLLMPVGSGCDRVIIVGRKRLPDPARRERAWALVAEVTPRPGELLEDLGPEEYRRGRAAGACGRARVTAGRGAYVVADHDGHAHLAYWLDEPPGDFERRELGLRPEASFIVAVRNPEAPAPPDAGLPRGRRSQLPQEVRERFRGRRWLALDDPTLLDHEGIELVLIAAGEDVEAELGIGLDVALP